MSHGGVIFSTDAITSASHLASLWSGIAGGFLELAGRIL